MAHNFKNTVNLFNNALQNALLHPVASDPSTPSDGQMWYRTDTDRFMGRANGVTVTIADLNDITGGAITGALWNAQSYIKAIVDDTPVVQTVGDGEFVGRPVGGNIGVMTQGQALTALGVESGATADQSAAELLAAILTVDGAASGLDADLLGGVASASYALKSYVDAITQGISWKDSVRAATTADVALTGTQTIDGVALSATDRVLVKNQTAGAENGIYTVAAGAWSRAIDADTAAEIQGAAVFVEEGTTAADTAWILSTDTITLDTTSLVFAQFGAGATYTAGAGLALTGTEFKVDAASVTDAMLVSTFTKKSAGLIGDNATTALVYTHNLGTKDVQCTLREIATDEMSHYPDYVATTTNTITINFAVAPTTGQYQAIVVG